MSYALTGLDGRKKPLRVAHQLAYNTLARADLFALYSYIEERNGPFIAGRYLDRIEALCASLATLAERGVDRGDSLLASGRLRWTAVF